MTLGQNMKVKVNHKRVTLPIVKLGVLSVVQEGYSVVVRTNIGKEPDLSHIPYCVFFSTVNTHGIVPTRYRQ